MNALIFLFCDKGDEMLHGPLFRSSRRCTKNQQEKTKGNALIKKNNQYVQVLQEQAVLANKDIHRSESGRVGAIGNGKKAVQEANHIVYLLSKTIITIKGMYVYIRIKVFNISTKMKKFAQLHNLHNFVANAKKNKKNEKKAEQSKKIYTAT